MTQLSSNQIAPFQRRVVDWMMETFSMEVCRDTTERNHRHLEESLELVQSLGCTASEAHQLVDYVFGRPAGDPEQEVGGVMVTLAALCAAADVSMAELGDRELARCWQNIDRIRAKQAGKPAHSPLPGPSFETRTLRGLRSSGLSPHLPTCSLIYTFDTPDSAIEARKLIDAHFGLDRDVRTAEKASVCYASGVAGICRLPAGHAGGHDFQK